MKMKESEKGKKTDRTIFEKRLEQLLKTMMRCPVILLLETQLETLFIVWNSFETHVEICFEKHFWNKWKHMKTVLRNMSFWRILKQMKQSLNTFLKQKRKYILTLVSVTNPLQHGNYTETWTSIFEKQIFGKCYCSTNCYVTTTIFVFSSF